MALTPKALEVSLLFCYYFGPTSVYIMPKKQQLLYCSLHFYIHFPLEMLSLIHRIPWKRILFCRKLFYGSYSEILEIFLNWNCQKDSHNKVINYLKNIEFFHKYWNKMASIYWKSGKPFLKTACQLQLHQQQWLFIAETFSRITKANEEWKFNEKNSYYSGKPLTMKNLLAHILACRCITS